MQARMRAIQVENPGADYHLSVTSVPLPRPGAGEILIKVCAAGINRADILQAQGRYPPPPGASEILGLEVSGEVVALGERVSCFEIGDLICALLAGGGYSEFCVAPVECILRMPAGMNVADAAALPEAVFTAWTNLFETGRLRAGESVLVHGGSSGIGTAAIQMCAARGYRVFATAGTAEKCRDCEGLGASRAINYREEDFVSVVRQATGNHGVDVILDMVGGSYVQRNIEAAAVWGRIVNIAYQSGRCATVDFGPVLTKRLSLCATTLRSRTNAEKGAIRDAVLREVWPLLDTGTIVPVIDSRFELADAQSAHDRMENSDRVGKILLTM